MIRYLVELCTAQTDLEKMLSQPQFITTVRKQTPPPTTASAPTTTTAAPAASSPAAPPKAAAPVGDGYPYALTLEGAGSKPVRPLQVAVLNGNTTVAALLQRQPPPDCRSCEASSCTVM